MKNLVEECTHVIKIHVFEVEGVNVAWKVAVWFSSISQGTVSIRLGRGKGSLPKTGEADVDKEVGAASGDKEDTDRRNYRGKWSQRWGTIRLKVLRAEKVRRRRALTEDGDDNDEDGGNRVCHCVMEFKRLVSIWVVLWV